MDPKVIVIGAMNMDVRGRSENRILMRDSNPGIVSFCPGGVGLNIARNLSLLGEKPELFTALSDDAWGKILEDSCRTFRVGLSLAIRPENAHTGTYLYVTGPDHDLAIGLSDTRISDYIDKKAVAERLSVLNRAEAVVIDANLTEETLSFIASSVKAPLFADPVSHRKAVKLKPALHTLRLIKPNMLEAEALTGETDPENAAKALRHLGVKNVFISLGADGMYVDTDAFCGHVGALKADVKNTNGAGDASMAALIKAAILGLDGEKQAMMAMAAGAIAAESEETVSPDLSLESIERRLHK